jgi:hypothetical protein
VARPAARRGAARGSSGVRGSSVRWCRAPRHDARRLPGGAAGRRPHGQRERTSAAAAAAARPAAPPAARQSACGPAGCTPPAQRRMRTRTPQGLGFGAPACCTQAHPRARGRPLVCRRPRRTRALTRPHTQAAAPAAPR